MWITEIGKNIGDKTKLHGYLDSISIRHQSLQVQSFGISFWGDIKRLLEFDPKEIAYLSSFAECVNFYTDHFYKLDTAIRNLYAEFLNKKSFLEPFQERYKELASIFLDKWFQYFDGYQENQTGLLQRIIDTNSVKTAVIVGDGIGYELACQIADKVKSSLKLTRRFIIADIPSETENNMSRIYMDNGVTEKIQSSREKYLLEQNPDKTIDFVRLDDVKE